MTLLEVDLELEVGQFELAASFDTRGGALVITGPNGSGKSSLLLAVLGALRPRSGRVALGRRVLYDGDRGIDLLPEERRLGYVPQGSGLFTHLNARENVEFAVACRSPALGRKARRARALDWLAELGATRVAEQPALRLSGGERQRVALARALASEPSALLLDEPFAALDAASKEEVRKLVSSHLERSRLPAVIVSHDPADALALGHQMVVVEAGRIIQEGRLLELAERPASPFVEKLLRAMPRRVIG